MRHINVSPFTTSPEAKELVEVVRYVGRVRRIGHPYPVLNSSPIIVTEGFVGVGYVDGELELRPTYLLVPNSVGLPIPPYATRQGRCTLLPVGVEIIDLDTGIKWPTEVRDAFSRLVQLEMARMQEWSIWLRTRNRAERAADVYQAVGELNAKQLGSLADIPIKVVWQRFQKYLRKSGSHRNRSVEEEHGAETASD